MYTEAAAAAYFPVYELSTKFDDPTSFWLCRYTIKQQRTLVKEYLTCRLYYANFPRDVVKLSDSMKLTQSFVVLLIW